MDDPEFWRQMAAHTTTEMPYRAMTFYRVPLAHVFKSMSGSFVAERGHNLVVQWCRSEFGEPGPFYEANSRWACPAMTMPWAGEYAKPIAQSVAFRDAVDATMFRLRWC